MSAAHNLPSPGLDTFQKQLRNPISMLSVNFKSNGSMTKETANDEAARWWLHNPPIQPHSEIAIAPGFTAATDFKYAAARPPLLDQPGVPPYDFHPSMHPGVSMNPYNSPHGITSENSVDISMSSPTPFPEVNARVSEYFPADSLLTFSRPTSHSEFPGTCRPGRRGSRQCSRCRSHKRGKRVRICHIGIY